MGRLIDADKLKAHYSWWDDSDEMKRVFTEIIDYQETVEAVPVIRCAGCRFFGDKYHRCGILDTDKTPEGYCDEAIDAGRVLRRSNPEERHMSAVNYHQVTLSEWLNGGAPFDPLETVAKKAAPNWKTSREEVEAMIRNEATADVLAEKVLAEYCPYGAAGHYCCDDTPETVTAWDMSPVGIRVKYNDAHGRKREDRYTWRKFAETIRDLFWRGEYGPGNI